MLKSIVLSSSLIPVVSSTGVLRNFPISELMNPNFDAEAMDFRQALPVLRVTVENVTNGVSLRAVLVSPQCMDWDPATNVAYEAEDVVRFIGLIPRVRLK